MTFKSIFSALGTKFLYGRLNVIAIIFIVTLFSACREDEVLEQEIPDVVSEENQYVNDWILENMEVWYLWNNELPSNINNNLDPSEYFPALLSDDDRFSWLQPNYEELVNSLQGITKEAGFEFVLYKESSTSENVVAQILYVKSNSPAESAGLKRGDLITKINNQQITTGNYKELIADLRENHTLEYKPLVVGEQRFDNAVTVSLSAVEYSENPHHLYKVIEDGDRKIGYYVYNFFATGASDNDNEYDTQMEQIFSFFKGEGITDLVLDLRFNSGGSETSAKHLASYIGSGIGSSNVFFSRTYNGILMDEIKNDPELGEEFLKSYFLDKAFNVGNQLRNGRVYILTSSRTASASELIINSLDPYMDVFLIGDVTYGKNVGSISIYEENDPKNTWGLQPIIVKVANSAGFSEYGDGFTPDIENKDNGMFIYPLGDIRENLLAEAIAHINGLTNPGRVRASSVDRTIVGHSLDEKRRGFNLFMEQAPIK
jgi:carboxyl-terminal processing protease